MNIKEAALYISRDDSYTRKLAKAGYFKNAKLVQKGMRKFWDIPECDADAFLANCKTVNNKRRLVKPEDKS